MDKQIADKMDKIKEISLDTINNKIALAYNTMRDFAIAKNIIYAILALKSNLNVPQAVQYFFVAFHINSDNGNTFNNLQFLGVLNRSQLL
jgi:hypothetical protein